MIRRTLSALLALILWTGSALAADEPKCGLTRVAELEANTRGGRLLIKIQINGLDAWAQLDTGSPFNMISPRLVEALKLKERPIREGAARDGSGTDLRHMVKVDEMKLNGMTAKDVPFVVMGESGTKETRLDGIFGANFLAGYDVELDMPHNKVNLFTQDHCKGHVVYWTSDYTAVPFAMDASMHPVLRASLEGHEFAATLDTGAMPSILSAQTARHAFDLDPGATGAAPDGQVTAGSGATLPFYRHRFTDFEIGGVAFRNTEFIIMPDKVSRIIREHESRDPMLMPSEHNMPTPLVIGLHHLSKLRAFIAYSERVVYFSAGDAS